MNRFNKYLHCFFYSLFLILILTSSGLKANKYDVANIPDHLKEDAIAVLREEHTVFTVKDASRAELTVKKVVTILERRAEALADLYIPYDDLSKVKKYSGTIYDADGNKVRKLKKDEFIDQSATSSSLYDDNRIIYTDLYRSQLPFTVEFEYQVDYKKGFFFPGFFPQSMTELSVENSSFTVISPEEMDFRWRAVNHKDLNLKVTEQKKSIKREWSLNDLPAIEHEPYMPSIVKIAPYLMVASNDFVYGDVAANMSTWDDYGKWILKLNQNRQTLPEETRLKVQDLVKDVDDTREKIRIIYEYMQSRTRYVSIQLGIGGFQTFDAETVDRTGYGDCKALSNYTHSLLKEAGIESYYTVIYNGSPSRKVLPDFPDMGFNHIILAVPVKQDTIWLECTSNHYPMGHIGEDNADRYVLMVTPEGGKLVRTPKYEHARNKRTRTIDAILDKGGDVELNACTRYQGLCYSDRLGLSLLGEGQQLRYLQKNLGINNPEISEIKFNQERTLNPVLEENISVKTVQYISRAGNRILFLPNILSRRESVPASTSKRIHEVRLNDSALYSDTVNWIIPEGYSFTYLPEDIEIDNEFGYFSAKFIPSDNQLTYQRVYYTKEGTHPPESYESFVDFFNKIHNSDRAQVVISPQ